MHFHIKNMTCGNCVKHVSKAIAAVDPSAKITADTTAHTIEVTTTASQEAIERALATDGYPATVVEK